MKFSSLISFLIAVLIIAITTVGAPGCANIIPPQGGPRDSLPPVLVKSIPEDQSKNFTEKRITFSFDEYVDIQNVFENLIVSPIPKNNPEVKSKLNTVTVRLKDTLEANTTYSLNFGNAIKDVNEGNVFKNFTYTFSTGSFIDSLELRGNVILAETGKTDTTLTVMLHTSGDDSAVVNQKPRYIAKLDNKGNFVFKNLPPKTFYLYALKDEGGTHRYFDDTQLFAFADSAITIGQQNDSITLYAYASPKESKQTAGKPSLPAPGRNNRNNNVVDQRLKYQTNLANGQQDLLSALKINFETPLKTFDSTKINLYTDTLFTPVTDYHFEKDSTNQTLTLVHEWKENTIYNIIFEKDFAEDSSGYKLLKTDTLTFTTKKLADYGSLTLNFKNIDLSKNPVVQILFNNNILRSYPLSTEKLLEPLFLPGEYQLRILYDDNKNGMWDPGIFFKKHQQPELVIPLEKKVVIKPNWKNEVDVEVPPH